MADWLKHRAPLGLATLVGLALGTASVFGTDQPPLVVAGYPKAPYMIEGSDISPGLCAEVVKAAAKRAGIQIEYRVLPNPRLIAEFRQGLVAAEPCVFQQWRAADQSISRYTSPYFSTVNVVIRRAGAAPVAKPADLAGTTLGTGADYVYTDGFQQAFEQGVLQRQDVADPAHNISKLAAGRVDGIIIDQLTARYWISELGLDAAKFAIVYQFKTQSDLAMRVHQDHSVTGGEFNVAIQAMQADGTLQAIINKYQVGLPHIPQAKPLDRVRIPMPPERQPQ